MNTVVAETVFERIDPLHRDDILNAQHASFFFETDDYCLLIARFFTLGDEELTGVSIPFVIFDDNVYHYDREAEHFNQLEGRHEGIHRVIDHHLAHGESLIERYIEEIDHLEDSLYNRRISPIFLDIWFDLKKDMTRMDRIFERSQDTIRRYVAFYATDESFPNEPYVNILEHLGRYQRIADLNTLKLDTLYSYYNSLKNDKLNNNIYTLTVLSGVFLPLNLIVGFFGMNTQNLFFSEDPTGTMKVVFLLVLMLVLLLALFPFIRFVEHHLLKRLLGRFNLYNNLVESLKKITLFK